MLIWLFQPVKHLSRYPECFESQDGLQMSYIFIKSMAGSSEYSENPNPKVQLKVLDSMKGAFDSSSFNYARLGISRIYKLICGNQVSRNKSMSSVVRKLTLQCGIMQPYHFCCEFFFLCFGKERNIH